MAEPRPWVPRAMSYLVGLTLALLLVEYLLGLWTNAYAPGMFTRGNYSFAPLAGHVVVGYLVGLVALGLLVVAVLSRVPQYIAQSAVIVVTIGLAGTFGMLFIGSAPNAPIYSFAMGLMFIIAFGTCSGLSWHVWRGPRTSAATAPVPPTQPVS